MLEMLFVVLGVFPVCSSCVIADDNIRTWTLAVSGWGIIKYPCYHALHSPFWFWKDLVHSDLPVRCAVSYIKSL